MALRIFTKIKFLQLKKHKTHLRSQKSSKVCFYRKIFSETQTLGVVAKNVL